MIALLRPHLLHPTVGDSSPSPAAGGAGRMETGTCYLMALGVAPCVPVARCVHGAAFWARKPTPGVIYTPPSRWLAGCLNLAVWQGCAADNTGEPGQGRLGGGYFTAVIVTAQSGTGGMDSVPARAACPGTASPGAMLQGLLLSPVLSHGHFAILSCVTCGSSEQMILGEREGMEGGTDLDAWILLPERGTAGAMLYS